MSTGQATYEELLQELAACRDVATAASGHDDSEAIANPLCVAAHVSLALGIPPEYRRSPPDRNAIVECVSVIDAVLKDSGIIHDCAAVEDALEKAGIIEWQTFDGVLRPHFDGAEDLEEGDLYWTITPKWSAIRALSSANAKETTDV